MKLGIAVVYLVKEENEPLLDLHLAQIEKHTSVPYTIYGSANRLLPSLRAKIEKNPRITICDIPTSTARSSAEHAYYLDALLKVAVDEGATHLATMHVDSFPVKDGWVEELDGQLDERTVLAGVMREEVNDDKPHPSLVFFTTEFYREYSPRILGSDEDRESSAFKRYLEEVGCLDDGGVGLGFKIHSEGLSWVKLTRSNKADDHYTMGSVYGDVTFHLGAAARDNKVFIGDALTEDMSPTRRRVQLMGRKVLGLFPQSMQDFVIRHYFSAHKENQVVHDEVRSELFDDPDGYLRYLRTGERD